MADLISIVVPVYNAENSLEELYLAIKKQLQLIILILNVS
ncbi:hypothetical protein HSACCH_00383 [Halanaerobium saccharolyticum subsp. saccharolyticum DSM 6643]|uniref:Glycosyl transferase family 2 n=1 Tax=Halanaerobium saccharolyticum subsp. saccharolyticum DSM 6643 TaxID=1293054 RepID=M5DYM4_9FIRM|nr:hypothetical protein HSACCH_00383 [Halanaerobium saccharolyticum subsp. saccharolyticum DSM 6643]